MAKTKDEIDALKENWRSDPIWDIEDTEGFEDHREELLAYRKEIERNNELKRIRSASLRAELMKKETGIIDPGAAQSLFTFSEIENDVTRNGVGEATPFEMSMVELSQAQTRATLLLAAQVKRVADALESLDAQGSLDESARIWGSGK